MRSEPVRLLSIAMAASIAAGLSLPAAAQWKWRDRVGHVQYSDRPPPPGIAENDILQRPQAAQRLAASPVASKAASAAASAVSAPLPAARASEPELEARRRKAEQEEAARRKGDELRQAAVRADNCLRARNELRALDEGQRVVRYNASGEREFLDDEARAVESQRVRGVVAADCR